MRVKSMATTFIILLSFVIGFILGNKMPQTNIKEKDTSVKEKEENSIDFSPYYLEFISDKIHEGVFRVGEKLSDGENFKSYLFRLEFKPRPGSNTTKMTTGLINIPNVTPAPIVVMIRGYVDQKIYSTGVGTRKMAEYLASRGFITIAPDFLGYGGSDKESENIFETRFQTYSTVIALGKSLSQISQWDGKNVFIWGHSNGGQIALGWIVAQKLDYPTVLWAPVTKPFPYNVLYYTDESPDGGKLIRQNLAKLEEHHDANKFSFATYPDRINAPIQVHQGAADQSVPVSWNDKFVATLRAYSAKPEYYIYEGDDHNLSKNWNVVAERTFRFFEKKLK